MGMAGLRASFLNITSLYVFLLLITMSASSSKATTNLLLTGETLSKNSKLSYPDSKVRFQLGGDCNLVLFNDKSNFVWQSGTIHYSIPWPECTLSFTDNGRLLLNGTWAFGNFSWITPNADSKVGKYVAILHPEGKLSIYGPSVWAAGLGPEFLAEQENTGNEDNGNKEVSSMRNLKYNQTVYNALFSGQELYNNDKLVDGSYSFILKECSLVIQNNITELSSRTWTKGNGQNCFAKLNHKAQLAIIDDTSVIVWSSGVPEEPGEYVLVMQQNGNAVIYGPEVWSTAYDEIGFIEMRTTNK